MSTITVLVASKSVQLAGGLLIPELVCHTAGLPPLAVHLMDAAWLL